MFWYRYLGIDKLKEGSSKRILSAKYILKNGILRQKEVYSKAQKKTKKSFSFKWAKRDTYESKKSQTFMNRWLVERYLEGDKKLLSKWIKNGSRFLDAGCGAGHTTLLLFGKVLNRSRYLGIDISDAVDVARQRFKENGIEGEFIQADLTKLPFSGPLFDIIYSEGVLHHTDSTEKSFKYLSKLLADGGRFLFYVYKKKGPIREFVDDYIREYLKDMSDEAVWKALLPLTKLGKAIGDLDAEMIISEDIPYLGIKKGKIGLHKFFYWNIFKAFYRPEFTIDEMNHINFDWYRPLNSHRHNPEEIKKWCKDCSLRIERLKVEESGITGVAVKQKETANASRRL